MNAERPFLTTPPRPHDDVPPDKVSPTPAGHDSVCVPGRNCFARGRADRLALLIDGEAYFRTFMQAAERAQRSITILAWDFDSRTRLHFDPAAPGAPPARLGEFLNWLARRRHRLMVRILDWDYPMVFGTDRELPPRLGLGWKPHRRVHFCYDNTHPVSASHHQKIVVIDDALAFVGGFDLTVRRWDTPAHRPDDSRRECADKAYPPFHDLMLMFDGEAARAIGEVARERWLAATGHRIPEAKDASDPWPDSVRPELTGIDVALARTLPPQADAPPVNEVEQLFLDMIASARERIYIESQYFTAGSVGEALAARLAEPDGPEVIVVVRLFSHGWLEEHTMHVLRTRLVERLSAADRHGRFRILYPHIDGLADKVCIDLHSKLMIVDDDMLRVGSANLSNRSMGMDSECDAVIEARGNARVQAYIRDVRHRLLAEHLDVEVAAVVAAFETHGALGPAIEALSGRTRTLLPLNRQPDWPEAVIELARVGDPQQPITLDRLVEAFSPELQLGTPVTPEDDDEEATPSRPPATGRRRWSRAAIARVALPGAVMLLLLGLALVWRYTPLTEVADAERVTGWARAMADSSWAPMLILLAYTPACLLMFPRPLITLAAVIAFGPEKGFVFALSGILIAAFATYAVGLLLPEATVHRIAGPRLPRIAETLRRRGLLAITALRLVPIAPFAIEGVVAAAIGIRLAPFLLGTLFGMLPGTLATTVFGDQLEAALDDPGRIDYGLLLTAAVGIVLLSLFVRRWLVKEHRDGAGQAVEKR